MPQVTGQETSSAGSLEDREAGAAVAAIALNIGDTIFGRVPVTGMFRFNNDSETCVKTGQYLYKRVGRTFRTSVYSAVFAVAAP